MKRPIKPGTRVEITTGTNRGQRGRVTDAFGVITWVRLDDGRKLQIGKGSLKRIESSK
jgi:hypothetical protein